MRKFIITNPERYEGEIQVVYNAEGILAVVDFTAAKIAAFTIDHFNRKVPSYVSGLQTAFSEKVTIVEEGFAVTLDMFWNRYDKKVNRKRCLRLWEKLSKTDQVKAFYGIEGYDKYLKKESWRSKADPEKYLRDRYWENEWR